MDKMTAVIIGCGRIGALKEDDQDYPGGRHILTHAHAIHDSPDFDLVGLIDSAPNMLDAAWWKWTADLPERQVKARTSYQEYYKENGAPDLVVIATPSETHLDMVKEVLFGPVDKEKQQYAKNNPDKADLAMPRKRQSLPNLIILEKPGGDNWHQASIITNMSQSAGVPIWIGYQRRFLPEYQRIKDILISGEIGRPQLVRGVYNRGIRHDGSHMIDLLQFFFSALGGARWKRTQVFDYSESDPTLSFDVWSYLQANKGIRSQIDVVDGRQHDMFELDIITTAGRIMLMNHGIEVYQYRAIENKMFGGGQKELVLVSKKDTCLTTEALPNMYAEAARLIRDEEETEIPCTAKQNTRMHIIVDDLIRQVSYLGTNDELEEIDARR